MTNSGGVAPEGRAGGVRRHAVGARLLWTAILLLLAGTFGTDLALFDLAALVRPLLVALGIIGWLLLADRGMRLWLGSGFALAAVVLMGRDVAMAAAGFCERPLTVLQWNMRLDNRQPAVARAWLARQDADVLLLAEAPYDLPDALADRWPHARTCQAHGACSTVVLTRAAPRRARALARGDAENRRALSAARIDLPGASIVALHLSRPWPIGAQAREGRWLAAALTDVDPALLIIGGDFNATPAMAAVRSVARRHGLARADAPGFTWPAWPFPVIAIDHLLIGRGWQVMATERLHGPGSDHLAQRVSLCPVAPAPTAG